MTDLLEVPLSPSPRLRWLAEHNLILRHYDGPHGCGGPEDAGWVCGNRSRTYNAGGADEREAELAYAARYGIEHWAVKEWEEAMADATNTFAKATIPLVQRALDAMDEAESKFYEQMAAQQGMCLD